MLRVCFVSLLRGISNGRLVALGVDIFQRTTDIHHRDSKYFVPLFSLFASPVDPRGWGMEADDLEQKQSEVARPDSADMIFV